MRYLSQRLQYIRAKSADGLSHMPSEYVGQVDADVFSLEMYRYYVTTVIVIFPNKDNHLRIKFYSYANVSCGVKDNQLPRNTICFKENVNHWIKD